MLFHEKSVLILLSRKGPGCMVQQGVTGGTNLMSHVALGHICDLPGFVHHDYVDLHSEKPNFCVHDPR